MTDDDWHNAKQLVEAYAASLEIDLDYQDFDTELASLASTYDGRGGFWLAFKGTLPIGCVAVRELDATTAELKRLYVSPEGRGAGLGRQLTKAALAAAKHAGYTHLRLDTLGDMLAARALYRELGFKEIEPYYDSPVVGTSYMEIEL